MKQKNYIFYLIAFYFIINVIGIFLYQNHIYLTGEGDDKRYFNSAVTLLREHKLVYEDSSSTIFIMPGLPLLLSFVMFFFGTGSIGFQAFRILECIIQTGSLYLVYKIATTLFSKKTAYVSVIFMMLYIPNYNITGFALTEVPFAFFSLLLSYFTILAIKEKRMKYYTLAGISWALATYFRSTLCLFPIILFILWFKNRYSIKEITKYGLTLFSVFILVMSPWYIRNAIDFHKFIPYTESSGNPLLYGAKPFYKEPPKDFIKKNPDYVYFKDVDTSFEINYLPNSNERMNSLGISLYKYEFFNEPATFFEWVFIGKIFCLYSFPFYAFHIFKIPSIIVLIFHLIFLSLSIIGLCSNRSKGIIRHMILYLTLIYLPFFTYNRYAYPTMPFVLMMAAIGFSVLINLKKGLKPIAN